MDSEWRKTPKFIYGKVLESSGKFRVKPGKVRNILEGGGTGPAGPAPPGEAHHGWPSGRQSPSPPPPCELERWEDSLLPTSFLGVLFPFILARLSLDWFEQKT